MGLVLSLTRVTKALFAAALSIMLVMGVVQETHAGTEALGTPGTPGTTMTMGGAFTNTTLNSGTADYAIADAHDASNTFTSIDIDFDATLYIWDATGGDREILNGTGAINIATGTTFTIVIGHNGDGENILAESSGLNINGATTGGGSLVIDMGTTTAADSAGAAQPVDFNSAVTVEDLTITGTRGDQAAAYTSLNTTIVDLAGGIVTVNDAMIVKGGLGGVQTAGVGGLVTVTTATSMINAVTSVHMSGGDGGISVGTSTGAIGGGLTVTLIAAGITSPTITFSGGTGGTSTSSGAHAGGAGGAALISDITTVAMDDYTTLTFTGGTGGLGSGTHASAAGGAGGSIDIADSNVAFGTTSSALNITGGAGAMGGAAVGCIVGANGGAGGAVLGATFAGVITGTTTFSSGNGANGGAATLAVAGGVGGAGGALTIDDIEVASVGNLTIKTGNGGAAGVNSATGVAGVGGVGGVGTFSDMHGVTGNLILTSGSAGHSGDGVASITGAVGGAGGALTLTKMMTGQALSGTLSMTSGNGGNAGDGVVAAVGGIGQVGGDLTSSQTTCNHQDITLAVSMTSGDGGNGGTAGTTTGAVGGQGGDISVVELGDMGTTLTALGGTGGTGGASTVKASQTAGAGGRGGAIGMQDTASVVTGDISYTGGAGGNGGSANCVSCVGGKGGAGGILTMLLTGNQGEDVSLVGGAGGNGSSAVVGQGGQGGAGGTIAATIVGNIAGTVFIDDGNAGSAGGSAGGTAGIAGVAGTVVLNLNATTVTGAVTVGDTGEGTINTATSAVVFSKSIGTSSKSLGTLAASIATSFTGNVYVDTLDSDNCITITNLGTSENVYSGAITGDMDLVVTANSHANLEGVSTVDTLNVAAAGRLELNDAMTIQEDNGLTIASGAIIELGSGIVAGETAIAITGSNDVEIANAMTVVVSQNFTSGVITFIDDAGHSNGDANATTSAGLITVTANTLATYAATKLAADQSIIITATKKSSASIASALGVTASAARGLDAAASAAAADAAIATIINTTLAAGGAGAKQLAEQIQGSQDGLGATSGGATASAGAAVISVGSSRMAALRSGNAYASTLGTGFNAGSGAKSNNAYASTLGTGFSAGSGAKSNSWWMKPFASFGDQGLRKGVAGYEADTYGVAVGADTRLNAQSIAGLGFSFADTDVDGKGSGNSHSDIRSYQLTAYADYTEKDWYVEGLVGYAHNDMDTSRDITATNAKAKGDAKSGQYMVSVNSGMPMKAEGLPGAFFTPTFGLNITHVANKAYTETGAGVLNLTVSPEDITIVKASVGGRLHTQVESDDGIFVPELRAKLLYDMAGDDGSSSNTFTGGGAAFQVDGMDVTEFATSVGVGFAFAPKGDEMDGMSFSVNYDAEFKRDFTGQSGNFNFRHAF